MDAPGRREMVGEIKTSETKQKVAKGLENGLTGDTNQECVN